jgi:hypothetical protein
MQRDNERDYIASTCCHVTGSTREFYETVISVYIYIYIYNVDIKCQLRPTEAFIADLIACSTYFGHPCDFDRASSLICGNKMPTRCNRGFYCRSYCLLNMFRAPLCPSSGAHEYYTVVAACGIWCCDFKVAGLVWS